MNILVNDIGVETGVIGDVFRNLNSSIGQQNRVLALDDILLLRLSMAKVIARFVVCHVVAVSEKEKRSITMSS
jgi:hypothetical protein